MAAESNMDLQQGVSPSFFHNRRMVSFQSGAVNSSNMVECTDPNTWNVCSGGENISLSMPHERISRVLHPDPALDLRHDAGLALSWSLEEQLLLEEGLARFSNEPSITKYVKIAATLQKKTVRDVAFRCKWMTKESRRRKKQDYSGGKIMKDHKVKEVDFSFGARLATFNGPLDVPPRPFMANHQDCSANGASSDGSESCITSSMRQLLDENAQVLCQIKDNLDSLKMDDNIRLLFHAKNNLASILDRMSKVARLAQMAPLPIALDENLFTKFLFLSPQVSLFGLPERF
ncbi:uncharacterized protein LOC144710725 isoform X2 [Wolffia australiana]